MKTIVVHKQGKQMVTKYAGYGIYEQIASPLCVGAKAVYAGNSYLLTRMWKRVTCKHCLNKRKKDDDHKKQD